MISTLHLRDASEKWGEVFNDLRLILFPEKVLVILRDGRKLLGVFRSYDQFGTSFFCFTGCDYGLT